MNENNIIIVLGYHFTPNEPVLSLLYDSYGQFKLVTSGSIIYKYRFEKIWCFFDKQKNIWIPTFRNMFKNGIVPKKYIDSVIVSERNSYMPFYLSQKNVLNATSCVKYNPRYIITQEELKSFFTGFDDTKYITHDFNGEPKYNLFNCQELISESQFINRFFNVKHYGKLKSRLIIKYFFNLIQYDNGKYIYIPNDVKFCNMFFEKEVDFFNPSETPTDSIHNLFLRKSFKHIVEKICPFVSVSMSEKLCEKSIALAVSLANQNNLSLEFSPFREETCFACEVENIDNKIYYVYASEKSEKEILGLQSDLMNRLPLGSKSTEIKLKTRRLALIKDEFDIINRSITVFQNRIGHYICYDSAAGKILMSFPYIKNLISEFKKINKLPITLNRIGFYGCDRALRLVRKKVRQGLVHRIITKPFGINCAKISSLSYHKSTINNLKNSIWFDKGRVSILIQSNNKPKTVTTFDFSNFYSKVILNEDIDTHLARTLTLMLDFRKIVPDIKLNIVSLIGLSRHYDFRVFNLTKEASVAKCLSTIELNPNKKLASVCTDSITFLGEKKRIKVDHKYNIKRESLLNKFVYYISENSYFGWDKIKKQFIVRGVVGNDYPLILRNFIARIIHSVCLKIEKNKGDVFKAISRTLWNSKNKDFVFEHRKNAKSLFYPAEYVYQEMCQDRYLVYADMLSDPNRNIFVGRVHDNPQFLNKFFSDGLCHVNCVFALDIDRFIDLFITKSETAFRMLLTCFPKRKTYLLNLHHIIVIEINRFFKERFGNPQKGCVIPGALNHKK